MIKYHKMLQVSKVILRKKKEELGMERQTDRQTDRKDTKKEHKKVRRRMWETLKNTVCFRLPGFKMLL